MPGHSPLTTRLAAVLPPGLSLQAYHLSTPPTSTPALFAPLSGHDEEVTSCESHLLAVSSPQDGQQLEVMIYAIEILILTTNSATTLFVSKADSSGFLSRLNQSKSSTSVLAAITTAFVEYLLEPRLSKARVVLSLFARSQKQYLFPGSSENAGKHILHDRQLIKWWCRVFDKILRLPRDNSVTSAHLLVPGCDKGETKAFFPASSRGDAASSPKWVNSYPVNLLVSDTSVPPRHLIPRLPDDPKTRFLDDLDGDHVDDHGRWRSVKSLDQFWEMLSYRQECSAGRLVGFLWLIFSQGQIKHAPPSELEQPEEVEGPNKLRPLPSLLTPGNSQMQENGTTDAEPLAGSRLSMIEEPNSPPPSSPVQAGSQHNASDDVDNGKDVAASNVSNVEPVYPVIEATLGEVILDESQYQSLMDYLLQTDFAGEDQAAEATSSWIKKALELSRAASFGQPVLGCARPVLAPTIAPVDSSSAQVNVLTGIRKKRKADAIEGNTTRPGIVAQVATMGAANMLSAGLVRKKPKS